MPRQLRGLERTLEEARTGSGVSRFGTVLANTLKSRRGPPLLIVLDDFHEVAADPAVTAIVDLLLRHLPPSVRILIGSRSTPPLSLDRMRARNEVFELDSSHLRLTRAELAQLFEEIYRAPLDDAGVAALDEATHGWPTAVHLVYESLRRSPARSLETVLAEFRTSALDLHDYLSHEVFARLEPDERRLLERMSALDRFDAGLVATLAGLSHGRTPLQRLAHRGVLRTFGAADGASYQIHDLVRSFVQRQIEAEGGPAAWSALEKDTAQALAERGEPESALRHFLLAGASREATELVSQLARPMLRQGRAGTLLQCLLDLPEAVVQDNLELVITLADCRQLLGQWDEADRLYEQALARCQTAGARALECRVLLGMSKVLNMRGKPEQVLGMAERGLAVAEGLDIETQVRLLQRKAGAHFYLGQYAAAVRILDEVRRRLPATADPELLLPTIHNLAMAHAARGRFREAAREFGAALAHVRGAPSPRAPLYLSNLAFLQAELGELADARAAAEEGLKAAQQFSNRAQEITCREALAQVLAQSGDLDGALAELRTTESMNREQRMDMIAGDLLALRARIFCARGQYRRAVGFLEEALAQLNGRAELPRFTEYTAALAWCELRAGRAHVARDRLLPLVARADAEENEFERMRVHYWLAEALLASGETRDVNPHLVAALHLVRECGYSYFLGLQAREEPAPLIHALSAGIEIDTVSAALAEAGSEMETPLLELLPAAPPRVAEAIVAILSELGGAPSLTRMAAVAKTRRSLQAATRTAMRRIGARLKRGTAPAAGATSARLRLFGPPRLEIDGRPVAAAAWRSQRAFQILMYLALHPYGANRDRLLESFWPGRRLAAGRRNFHPTLSYIRSVLPRAAVPPLQREAENYRLDPAYPITCDAWDVQRAFEDARLARDAQVRRAALEQVASLTRHPFLEGCYDDWADELQAQMRDRLERAHLELGALLEQMQDHEAALASFRRAAEFDAYRETTRAAIIECLVRLGNRRAALVEWDRLKALLRDELSVDPLPETTARVSRALGAETVVGEQENGESLGAQWVRAPGQAALKADP
jgi:ATP/maltotriose-dependent transcriptional regulator MalT/DNA-binding SARP family transcriptional activator